MSAAARVGQNDVAGANGDRTTERRMRGDERLHRHVRELRHARSDTRPSAVGCQPVRVDLAERGDVGGDHDASGRARELAALRVDDRAARAGEVDGAVGLPVRERRVLRAVQDLDRPGAQHEDAERDADDDREPADADEEPWLRKKGASAREYGWSRRPPVRLRGSVTLRLGSGDEKATAAAARSSDTAELPV